MPNSGNNNDLLRAIADELIDGNQSVTPPANQTMNVAQVGGTSTPTGMGASAAGVQRTVAARAANAAVTTVAGSALATAQTLIAASLLRMGLLVRNDTNKTIILRAGTTGLTTTDWSIDVAVGGSLFLPPDFTFLAWQVMASDAAAATGTVRITSVSQ